jgi:hypothetical protein
MFPASLMPPTETRRIPQMRYVQNFTKTLLLPLLSPPRQVAQTLAVSGPCLCKARADVDRVGGAGRPLPTRRPRVARGDDSQRHVEGVPRDRSRGALGAPGAGRPGCGDLHAKHAPVREGRSSASPVLGRTAGWAAQHATPVHQSTAAMQAQVCSSQARAAFLGCPIIDSDG